MQMITRLVMALMLSVAATSAPFASAQTAPAPLPDCALAAQPANCAKADYVCAYVSSSRVIGTSCIWKGSAGASAANCTAKQMQWFYFKDYWGRRYPGDPGVCVQGDGKDYTLIFNPNHIHQGKVVPRWLLKETATLQSAPR